MAPTIILERFLEIFQSNIPMTILFIIILKVAYNSWEKINTSFNKIRILTAEIYMLKAVKA